MRAKATMDVKEALVVACPYEAKLQLPIAGGDLSERWTTLWKEPPGHPTRVTFYQGYPAWVTLLPTLTHRRRIKSLMDDLGNVPHTILIRGEYAAGALSERAGTVSFIFYNAYMLFTLHDGEIALDLLPAEIEDTQLEGTSLTKNHLDPNRLYNVVLESVNEDDEV